MHDHKIFLKNYFFKKSQKMRQVYVLLGGNTAILAKIVVFI